MVCTSQYLFFLTSCFATVHFVFFSNFVFRSFRKAAQDTSNRVNTEILNIEMVGILLFLFFFKAVYFQYSATVLDLHEHSFFYFSSFHQKLPNHCICFGWWGLFPWLCDMRLILIPKLPKKNKINRDRFFITFNEDRTQHQKWP